MVKRYWRAFWIALGMTLRGEGVPPPSPLRMWLGKTVVLVKGVTDALTAANVDMTQKLKVDGRQMRLSTILETVRFRAGQEYPSLLKSGAEHSLTAITAGVVDDRHWIAKCVAAETLQNPAVQSALQALKAHLDAMPPTAP
jgi:predicted thioredoxin/glutaredoxin